MASNNQALAALFGACFEPRREPVKVLKVNGVPHRDAWMVAVHDHVAQVGITAHVYGGQLHAYIEALGRGREGVLKVGQLLAETYEKARGQTNAPEVGGASEETQEAPPSPEGDGEAQGV